MEKLNKIFRTDQLAAIDKYTIEHEPISSLELMERAAGAWTRCFLNFFHYRVFYLNYTELQLKSLEKILIARRARSSYETCFVISFLINHKTGSAIRRCLPD